MMAAVHDRMPVVIEVPDWPVWLGDAEGDAAAPMRPAGEHALQLWPISRAVNNVRNDGPDLLEEAAGGGRSDGVL